MNTLRITLFGGVRVFFGESQKEAKLTRKVQSLFAYLLIERHRFHHRDVLAGLFWSDYSQRRARQCLNTALWRMRKVLEPKEIPQGTYIINSDAGDIGFNPQCDFWLDVAIFEESVDRILAIPIEEVQRSEIIDLENGIKLYTSELMEDIYEDWAIRAREHKRLLYLNGLAYLMRYYRSQREFRKSLRYGQEILNIDPLREEVHREMMRIYLENKQRALAIRQYELCQQNLRSELGIAPMEETQSLHRSILTGSQLDRGTSNNQPNLNQAVSQLVKASKNLDLATKELERAVNFLREITEEDI
jgi:DNA-binding SARP family transcriptional activator